MEGTDLAIRNDQRAMLASKLKRGQLLENSPRVREALEIWEGVVEEASSIVDEARQQMHIEHENSNEESAMPGSVSRVTSDVDSGWGAEEWVHILDSLLLWAHLTDPQNSSRSDCFSEQIAQCIRNFAYGSLLSCKCSLSTKNEPQEQ